ncbi:MAG: amidohydrolase family protein [Coriobacteriia bacterium]|nr:amidohydrolase family protein [Coriobacteriia bacterium]
MSAANTAGSQQVGHVGGLPAKKAQEAPGGALPPGWALPTAPGDIIDAHVHLFTVGMIEEYVRNNPESAEVYRKALKTRRFGSKGEPLPDMTPAETAEWYAARLARVGVTMALVVSTMQDSAWLRGFIAASKGRIQALCYIDPRDPEGPALLEREMAAGFCGVKLFPVNRCHRLSDRACYPFFEKAEELGANVIIHYGVSVDPSADLRYADPLDLSPVARDFPGLTFVIAHFGAGWFEEVLKLAYARRNVCVDSSGTNNWRDLMLYELSLEDVFAKSIQALGTERILFGTDSGTMAPYREWIKYQQVRTLEELGLSAADRDLILRGNAVRIFGLDEPRGTRR